MVEIPAVRARCPERQREPRGDKKQPHDRHERCAQNQHVAPRLAEKGASTGEDKSALQRVVPAEVEIVAEGRLLRTVLRRLADEDRPTCRSFPATPSISNPRARATCAPSCGIG